MLASAFPNVTTLDVEHVRFTSCALITAAHAFPQLARLRMCVPRVASYKGSPYKHNWENGESKVDYEGMISVASAPQAIRSQVGPSYSPNPRRVLVDLVQPQARDVVRGWNEAEWQALWDARLAWRVARQHKQAGLCMERTEHSGASNQNTKVIGQTSQPSCPQHLATKPAVVFQCAPPGDKGQGYI